ncbi:hypothetical protein GW17_00005451 [Ensete ventricosum]|nr:hypothetical protein GW17_00005451 [Ensete ventricosum]
MLTVLESTVKAKAKELESKHYENKHASNKECNFDLYRLVQAVCTGPPGYRYVDCPLPGSTTKIDHRRSIEGKEDKRRRGKEERSTSFLRVILARTPSPPTGRPCAVAALAAYGSPVCCRRPCIVAALARG